VGETTQQEQQQYVTVERYKKLVEFVNQQLTANFNQLSETVEQLKNCELARQRIENEQVMTTNQNWAEGRRLQGRAEPPENKCVLCGRGVSDPEHKRDCEL
jgi:hypothetical protein